MVHAGPDAARGLASVAPAQRHAGATRAWSTGPGARCGRERQRRSARVTGLPRAAGDLTAARCAGRCRPLEGTRRAWGGRGVHGEANGGGVVAGERPTARGELTRAGAAVRTERGFSLGVVWCLKECTNVTRSSW